MNKILNLFDEQYVKNLLEEKVLPLYPDFSGIKKIKIHAYKKHIWEETYHVVIEFMTTFLCTDGKKKTLPIICSAHSNEPRKNVYNSLVYLWGNGFGRGYLTIPHPLFYSDYFQGTFYRGVEGNNLYYYIREKKYDEIESIITKAARWFAKLHNLNTTSARNFNKENSRIETVIPGIKHIVNRVKHDYPKIHKIVAEIFVQLNNKEKTFLSSTSERWLIHGDAHPENIIKMGQKKMAVIDFTDLCLSDFARDIGAFTQQLEFMSSRKIGNPKYCTKIKNLFVKEYFNNSPKRKLNKETKARIDTYYNWTSMRTAVFFLLRDKPEPERAYPIIERVGREMNSG